MRTNFRTLVIFILLIPFFASSEGKDISISRALAEIAILTDSEEISEKAVIATHKALIDVFGISFAGFDSPGVQQVLEQEKFFGGVSQATVWIDGTSLSAPGAAFVNSVLIHALDLDDVHIPSVTHITSVVVPAAFAVGQEQNASGREVLEAIILGIEISGRLGREYQDRITHGGFLPTSIIGGFGATAASCRLLGLSVEQTMDAFGIFYAHASGNRQALVDNTLTKRIQPAIACRAGIVSAYLAKKGISGPQNIFLSQRGLFRIYGGENNPSSLLQTDFLNEKDYFEIEHLSFKKYACCGWAHPAIEAAIEIAETHNLLLNDIDKIEIFFGKGGLVGFPWNPSSSTNLQVAAQFNAPYQIVSAIKNKKFSPAEITNKRIKEDIEVSEMAKKVIFRSPEPRMQGIRVILKDGQILEKQNPVHERFFTVDYMTYDDIIEKYISLIEYSGLISTVKADLLLKNIESLQNEVNVNDFIYRHLKIISK